MLREVEKSPVCGYPPVVFILARSQQPEPVCRQLFPFTHPVFTIFSSLSGFRVTAAFSQPLVEHENIFALFSGAVLVPKDIKRMTIAQRISVSSEISCRSKRREESGTQPQGASARSKVSGTVFFFITSSLCEKA